MSDDRHQRQTLGPIRSKHRFERPVRMPNVACVCGARTTAPTDFGVISQRDYVLDWFNKHLDDIRAKRKAERAAARAAK